MFKVLLSRSSEENAEFISIMENCGYNFSFINCPLIQYLDLKFDQNIIEQYSDIIISSKYAAKKLSCANTQKNIWVVGAESAKILAKKNYNIQYIGDNFSQLLQNIPPDLYQNMVYLSGQQITQKPPKKIKHLIIYQIKYTDKITKYQLEMIKEGVDYVMLYSYNSAKTFLRLIKIYNLLKFLENSTIIAISLKVAEILKPFFARIIYCEEGQHQQMKGLLIDDQKYRNN